MNTSSIPLLEILFSITLLKEVILWARLAAHPAYKKSTKTKAYFKNIYFLKIYFSNEFIKKSFKLKNPCSVADQNAPGNQKLLTFSLL